MKMKADWGGELQDEATCLDGRMRVKPARNELAGAVRIIHHIQWLYPLLRQGFHRRLKTVDIQAQRTVEFGELPRLRVPQPGDHNRPPGE